MVSTAPTLPSSPSSCLAGHVPLCRHILGQALEEASLLIADLQTLDAYFAPNNNNNNSTIFPPLHRRALAAEMQSSDRASAGRPQAGYVKRAGFLRSRPPSHPFSRQCLGCALGTDWFARTRTPVHRCNYHRYCTEFMNVIFSEATRS